MRPVRKRSYNPFRLNYDGLQISGYSIVRASTINKSTSFLSCLIFTILFNYSNSLSNETTSHEFFPSIKDCISGKYPIKAVFQMLIAIQSFLQLFHYSIWIIAIQSKTTHVKSFALLGLLKLISMLLFSFITTHDDPDMFNDSLVFYFVITALWVHLIRSRVHSKNNEINSSRKRLEILLICGLVLSSLFFYKHQVERVKYAYSFSAIFQWISIGLDIYFDWVSAYDLKDLVIRMNLTGQTALERK